MKELSETYGIENNIKVSDISRVSDIFTIRKQAADEDKIWNAVSIVAQAALDGFVAMREREGEKLKNDVLDRCNLILNNVSFIEERSPQTVAEYNENYLVIEASGVGYEMTATANAVFKS